MPADEVVTESEAIIMGYPVVVVHSVGIAPIDERPLTQGLEIRRADVAELCYLQIGPMRYTVTADELVKAVNLAFPFEAQRVKDARRGKFELLTELDAVFEATQRAFQSLTEYAAGIIPQRITGPLDLIAAATGTSPDVIAETGRAFGCEVVVDPLAESLRIDYGASGYPFEVVIRLKPPGEHAL